MTDLQLPDWLLKLHTKDRNKITRMCGKTVLCVAKGVRGRLTENQVVTALGVKRAIILRDERPGHYWVRGSESESSSFLDRIRDRGLPGFTTRQIGRDEEEWVRLAGVIADSLGLRIVPAEASASQPQTLVEQQQDFPSTSSSSQLEFEENLGSGEGESSSSSVGLSGSESGSGSGSSGAPSPSILGGESTHASAVPPPADRPQKRQRLNDEVSQQATSPPTTSPTDKKKISLPLLGIALAKLSPELVIRIFELCCEDEAHNFILEELASQGGRCLQLLKGVSSLWTRIISTSSEAHIKLALELSNQRLLHIEGRPNPSLSDAANDRDLGRFLRDIDPHRDRWGSVALLFTSEMLRTVKKKLSSPAPNVESLSLSVADAALRTDLALPLNDALQEEIGRPLNILGGGSDKLQRVLLKNIPCVWDPSPFTAVMDLALMNGVHLRFNQLIDFFRCSSHLQSIRFVNIRFIGGGPQVLEERIPLPYLRVLVLAELIEPVGLGILFISLDTPNCVHTRLDIRPGGAASIHPAFRSRVATTVKKVLALGKPSFLLFRSNSDTQGASWRSRDGGGDGLDEEDPSFEISFRGAGGGFAGYFCDLVHRVQESVREIGEIVVDVGRSVSGTIDEPLDLENQIIPTLLPSLFAPLNVVEVRAAVVAGFLEPFKDLLGPVEGEGWCFRALRTIRLRAIPPDELTVLPDPSAQCSLDSLIDHIRREHDGIDLKEAKLEDGPALTIILKGIKIDHTEATLAYVRVQEERKEEKEEVDGEEVTEEEVEEYGSG